MRGIELSLVIEGRDALKFDEFRERTVEVSDKFANALDVGWGKKKKVFDFFIHLQIPDAA